MHNQKTKRSDHKTFSEMKRVRASAGESETRPFERASRRRAIRIRATIGAVPDDH